MKCLLQKLGVLTPSFFWQTGTKIHVVKLQNFKVDKMLNELLRESIESKSMVRNQRGHRSGCPMAAMVVDKSQSFHSP